MFIIIWKPTSPDTNGGMVKNQHCPYTSDLSFNGEAIPPYPQNENRTDNITWWDHYMGTLPYYWLFVRRNHQLLVDSPHKESMMWGFDVFFVVSLQRCWKVKLWVISDTMMLLWTYSNDSAHFSTSNFSHTFICSHWIPCFNLTCTTLFRHILYSHWDSQLIWHISFEVGLLFSLLTCKHLMNSSLSDTIIAIEF